MASSNIVLMAIQNNQGYAPDQIETEVTLQTLLEAVQEAIEEYGEDAKIVTHESGNTFGARFGSIEAWSDLFSAANPDEDDEDDES